jgi:hypothetical protein
MTRPEPRIIIDMEPLQKAEVSAMQGCIAIYRLHKQLINEEKQKSHFLFFVL